MVPIPIGLPPTLSAIRWFESCPKQSARFLIVPSLDSWNSNSKGIVCLLLERQYLDLLHQLPLWSGNKICVQQPRFLCSTCRCGLGEYKEGINAVLKPILSHRASVKWTSPQPIAPNIWQAGQTLTSRSFISLFVGLHSWYSFGILIFWFWNFAQAASVMASRITPLSELPE